MISIKDFSDTEAAYIAGIIDGEGTIGLTRIHRHENRRPVVSISSTERPLLDYIRSVIGAGRITNKAQSFLHHSPSFAYVIANRQALALLGRVAPFLRTYKAERARLLLEEYLLVTRRNGRYTAPQWQAKQKFEARFLAIRVRASAKKMELEPPTFVNEVAYENGSPPNSERSASPEGASGDL